MTKSFVKTTKRNCLTSMSKPVAETAVQNLAIAFERYNDQHPHSLVKYCSPANSGAERHHQFKYGSVSGDTGKNPLHRAIPPDALDFHSPFLKMPH